ncbi:MAG: hypothetical protein M1818_003822 [Claussenomyces sp. TS43310]|nr:MAG: hypothetical protein M1818_003822 [Claussenomyces sp. TS43310]
MKFLHRSNVTEDVAIGRPEEHAVEPELGEKPALEPELAEKPKEDAQAGVQKVEAVTLLWTKKQLIVAYLFGLTSRDSVFLVFFVVSMEQQIQNNLSPYAISSFALVPLVGTTSIISSVIGGVFKLPIAKFIDLIGRAEGFAIMTAVATIGTGISKNDHALSRHFSTMSICLSIS